MDNVGMSNGSLMAQIQVDTMKKAMNLQERQILSVLQSAAPQNLAQPTTAPDTSKLTGLGQRIDIKA